MEKAPQKQYSKEKKETKEHALSTSPVTSQELLLGSMNQVFLITLENGDRAIFKPKIGELKTLLGKSPREHVEGGTYYKRGRAAYILNEELHFDFVPMTVIREVEGKIGSVQEFIPHTTAWRELSPNEETELKHQMKQQFANLFVFDYIIWNSDRNNDNFLINNGKIYAIDNDLSFGADKLKLFEEFFFVNISERIIENILKFSKDAQRQRQLRERLRELIEETEIDACINRIKFIALQLQDTYGAITKIGDWSPTTVLHR